MAEKKIPIHLAIIMDGNRRWAQKRGLPPIFGHKAGYKTFKKIASWCQKKGVKILTIYAFSTENWQRSKEEVAYLMKILNDGLKKESQFFKENNIRFQAIGRLYDLPKNIFALVQKLTKETEKSTGGILNLALSYGGRAEIIDACKKIIKKGIKEEKLDEKVFSRFLYTSDQPFPDLLVRTGGRKRISNFLIFQSAYTEIYFTDTLWPDFTTQELEEAFSFYQKQKRTFGK